MTAKRLIILVIALAALLAGYGVYWMQLAERLEAATHDWIAAHRAQGYTVDHAAISRGGFPLAVRTTIDDMQILAPAPSSWAWQGERTVVSTSPFRPDHVRIAFDGGHALALTLGDVRRTYTGSAADASVELSGGGWLPVATAVVRDLTLVDDESGDRIALEAGDLVTTGDPAAPADASVAGYQVALDATGLDVPGDWPLLLGNTVDILELRASVMGALADQPWPGALAQWRDAGGTVEVRRIAFAQGPFELEGEGTLALDGAGQPMGSMMSSLRGWGAVLAALAGRGIVNEATANTLTMVMNGLAEDDADGQPVLSVPLRLQDRLLSAGPMPVARLPMVDWLRDPASAGGM